MVGAVVNWNKIGGGLIDGGDLKGGLALTDVGALVLFKAFNPYIPSLKR